MIPSRGSNMRWLADFSKEREIEVRLAYIGFLVESVIKKNYGESYLEELQEEFCTLLRVQGIIPDSPPSQK
jgi:hypothetical protein